jgi:hypothetical protein
VCEREIDKESERREREISYSSNGEKDNNREIVMYKHRTTSP